MTEIYYIKFPDGKYEAKNGLPSKEPFYYSAKHFKIHVSTKAIHEVARANNWGYETSYTKTPKDIPQLQEKYKGAKLHILSETGLLQITDALEWIDEYYKNGYKGSYRNKK